MITRRDFLSAACVGSFATLATCLRSSAQAQALHSTARMLVGSPPGAASDAVARLLVSEMKGYASNFVVENRPGAGNRIALDVLKGNAADGSVAAVAPAGTLVIYPHVYRKLSYDALNDFIPVTTVCDVSFALTVGPMVPRHVQTLDEFVTWCKANPGKASYGTPGAGSVMHFTGMMLARAASFAFVHVPYPGPRTLQDVMGGQLAAAINSIGPALPHVRSGTLRALATTGSHRSTLLPDVPTFKELGYPDLEAIEWFGVFVPARTPAEIVEKLNWAVRSALKTNEVASGLSKLSFQTTGSTPDEFARLIKSDFARWGRIVEASGFKAED
jgi:tripartite-type tricarboxylate transporter receptor subunit TctC